MKNAVLSSETSPCSDASARKKLVHQVTVNKGERRQVILLFHAEKHPWILGHYRSLYGDKGNGIYNFEVKGSCYNSSVHGKAHHCYM